MGLKLRKNKWTLQENTQFKCFVSLDVDLIERFYPKTRFWQTLSAQKNTDKLGVAVEIREKYKMLKLCLICVKRCRLRDFEAIELASRSAQ